MTITPAQLREALTPLRAESSEGGATITSTEATALFQRLRTELAATPGDIASVGRSIGLDGSEQRTLTRAAVTADMTARCPGRTIGSPPSADDLRAYGATFRDAPAAEAASAYRAYASAFHVHDMSLTPSDLRSLGSLGDGVTYPDGADADAACSRPVVPRTGSMVQDCDGFALLADDFFSSAGFTTDFVTAANGDDSHRMLWAHRGSESLLVSNDHTFSGTGRHASRDLIDRAIAETPMRTATSAGWDDDFRNREPAHSLFRERP